MFARRRFGDDRGSMPVAMLVGLVAMSLSAGLATLVTGQLRSTSREADRIAAISASQAGLDAGLAKLRSAVKNSTDDWEGVLNQLPCSTATTGVIPNGAGTAASGASSAPTFSTSYLYFVVNPAANIGTIVAELNTLQQALPAALQPTVNLSSISGLSLAANVASLLAAPAAVKTMLNQVVGCTGLGGSPAQVPLYALLRSTATVGTVTRTLYATYKVRTTQETLDGGHLVIGGTSGKLCIGANSADLAAPPTPMYVYAVSCTADPNAVSFIYSSNLSLSLVKTRTNAQAAYPYGLCITSTDPPKDKDLATFTACKAGRNNSQMFAYDVNAQTYYTPYILTGVVTAANQTATAGTTATGGNYCLSADNTVTPPQIVLRVTSTYCGSSGRSYASFVPDASVGAGGAGVGSQQFVNFAEVGRCLDLTNENPIASTNAAKALITYPCKQSFTGVPYWNHRWFSPTVPPCYYSLPKPADCPASPTAESNSGQVYTIPDRGTWINQKFCMESPGANGGYVWVLTCSATDPNQVWTVYGASTDTSKAYRVMDMYGNCLMAAGTLGSAYQYSGWSYVITTTCSGLDQQKWNAPRSFTVSPLSGIQEK